MANDLDQWPIYDPLIKTGTNNISEPWSVAMTTLVQNLIGYLGSFGMLLPQVTTMQRDTIQSPQNGQIIYNTTLNTAQYFKNGTWTSI